MNVIWALLAWRGLVNGTWVQVWHFTVRCCRWLVLLWGVKNTLGRKGNKKASSVPTIVRRSLPVSVSVSLLMLGVYPLRVTQVNHHSSMFYEKWQPTRRPCDLHWHAEVYYRKRVIGREITASCLSRIVCEEKPQVCALTHTAFIYIWHTHICWSRRIWYSF